MISNTLIRPLIGPPTSLALTRQSDLVVISVAAATSEAICDFHMLIAPVSENLLIQAVGSERDSDAINFGSHDTMDDMLTTAVLNSLVNTLERRQISLSAIGFVDGEIVDLITESILATNSLQPKRNVYDH